MGDASCQCACGRHLCLERHMLRLIRAAPGICAYARYCASLICIAAFSVKPMAEMNYAQTANDGRRSNDLRSTNDSQRHGDS
jgi:hypothetical protein